MGIIRDFFDNMFREASERENYQPAAITQPTRGTNFTRFSELLPYLGWIEDSRLFILEGAEQHSVEGLGFVLEMIPQTGATPDMADLFSTLFTYMPAGAGVQWGLFGSPLVDDYLSQYVGNRLDPSKATDSKEAELATLYRELAVRRADYFARGVSTPIIPNSPYLLRNFRLFMSVTIPAKRSSLEDADFIAEIISLRETCITTLKTYYQYAYEWTPEDLINYCAITLNPHDTMFRNDTPHLNYDEGREIKRQIVAPNNVIRVSDSGLLFGLPQHGNDVVASCMSVRSYPKACTLQAMASLIGDYMQGAIGYSCPFHITIGIITRDFEQTRNVVQMKSARATQKAESPMARFMPELRDDKYDWDLAQRAYDEGQGTVLMYHQLVLYSRADESAKAIQSAQAVWRSKQFEIVEDTYMQVQAMIGSMPLTLTTGLQKDIMKAQRFTTKTVTNAVNMAPLLGEWSGVGSPVLPLWGRRGQHMSVDLFANTSGNFNGCVVGTSGSGKSLFLNDMAVSYLAIGGRVWIIDVGRSYEKLCHVVGGQYLEFTDEAKIRLNPFSMVEDIDEDLEMLVPLFAQMISPSQPMDDYGRRQLTMHIQSVWYDYGADATIDHVAYSLINNCEKGGPNPQQADEDWASKIRAMPYDERQKFCDPRIRDLGVQLFPYTSDGPYGKYFAGRSNINFDSNFIVLELEELNAKKDLQAVVMFLLMYKITQTMYLTRNQKKICIIDEAWALLGGGNSGDFIESGYRRARKYGGAFLTATQSVADYFNSKSAEAALNNSDWMFLLRQKPESIMALEKANRLVLSEHMRDMLLSVRTQSGHFSEVFVHAGQMGHGIGRVIMDPFSLLLFSSKAEDFEAVRHYREKGLSVAQAIEAVLRDRGHLSRSDRERIAA